MFLLSTRSLSGYGLDKIFALAKRSGCEGIDLSVDFLHYDTTNAEYLDELATRHSIPIASLTAPERKLTKKQLDTIVSMANDLGVSIINLLPPHRLDKEKDWFGEYLHQLEEKHPTLIINIVNAPPKTWLFVISEYGDARPETIKKITNHTALSIEHVEPESGVDLLKTFTLMGNTIGLVYLSDKTEEKNGIFPGEGDMPLESLLIRMKEAGYDGHFSLDIEPESLSAGIDDDVEDRIREAYHFLLKYFS